MKRDGLFPASILLLIATITTYILMVMGNVVTSTGSGLACPDWPLCYGTVVPPREIQIWFEWGHRLLGGASMAAIVLSTVFVWRNYRGLPRSLTGAIAGLILVAALFGGIIVITEAPNLGTFMDIAIVSFHLLIATLVLILLIFTFRFLFDSASREDGFAYKVLFGVVYFQILLGIIVRYSGATLACPDFPLCQGSIIPSFDSYLVTLHFTHRVVAVTILIVAIALIFRGLNKGDGIKGLVFTLVLILFQALWGILIVKTGMFLPYIVLHGANGFLLLAWLSYKSMPGFFPDHFLRSGDQG